MLIPLIAVLFIAVPSDRPFLHAPSVDTYAKHDPAGITILPEGRLLRPVGTSVPLATWPTALALSPGGDSVFVASEGVGQILTDWQSADAKLERFYPGGAEHGWSTAGACAFSPDGRTLYWSSGESGKVYFIDTATRKLTVGVPLNAPIGTHRFEDSYVMDLKVSADGKYVYCADLTNFRVAIIDVAKQEVISSVPVGRYPYALALAGSKLFVANIGVFEYSAIPPSNDPKFDNRGLRYPPFGFPSKQSEQGVEVEGRKVPGLGKPDSPEASSVYEVNVENAAAPTVVAKLHPGVLFRHDAGGQRAESVSAPNFLTVHGDKLYVSSYNNDIVESYDVVTCKLLHRQRIIPSPLVKDVRGVGPMGMSVSPDGTRLYVAEAGINAVAVLDASTLSVLGHIPTGWYPYRVEATPDGTHLNVICFRGYGNGPKGGSNVPESKFLHLKGSFHCVTLPSDSELKTMTQNVLAYNGIVDKSEDRAAMASPVIPQMPGAESSQIKYVVFITKENHTYDTIFDRIPGANGDPSLLRWGYHQKIEAEGQPTLDDAAVMVNHNEIAKQFTVSDNFYVEPEASGVGHRWLIGIQPNNFCQMTYTLGWDFKLKSSAPGRRASFGSNGSMAPEDYPEAGSMWHHLARYGKTFRNYGEGFEFAEADEGEHTGKTGVREVINMPMPAVLYDNTSRDFPIFNMNIPDMYRAEWFEKEFNDLYVKPGKPMPRFVNICLCNDHGTSPNPKKGYPYRASWMADNDQSFGEIVDYLSHTPYWKNMAIFVTEDDAGGEQDHIDAQRSVMLIISPWARHGYVSHRHTTITSMHRTMYEIFGMPALNMFDALANDFADSFVAKPDFTPYKARPVDKRIFDWSKVKDPNDPDYRIARTLPTIQRDPEPAHDDDDE